LIVNVRFLMASRKSQIAIKALRSPDTSIFWPYASNATQFERSCVAIGASARPFDGETDLGTDLGNEVLYLTGSRFSEYGSQYTRGSTHMYSIASELYQKAPIQLWYSGAQEKPTIMGVLDSGPTIPLLYFHLLRNLDVTDNNDMQSNNGYRNTNRRRELQESLNTVDSFLRYPFPAFIQCRHRARWRHKAGWTSVASQTNTLHQIKQIKQTLTKILIRF
jgi:hypothetical protein